MKLGLMGGTFNPPHIGHLVCAAEACQQLQLDEVAFVPVNQPPHNLAQRRLGDDAASDHPGSSVLDRALIRHA